MFVLLTSFALLSCEVKVYFTIVSHLVWFLVNSHRFTWLLHHPQHSRCLNCSQIRLTVSIFHKCSMCMSPVSALSHPLQKNTNEVFHLLFFTIWNCFIIDRYIVCFCEYMQSVQKQYLFICLYTFCYEKCCQKWW